MSINIFNLSKASFSSKVPGFSSVATKADSLVDKVLKLFMAIILVLVSAIKYSEGLITSSFKGVKPKTTIEKLAFAANATVSRIKKAVENQSTIIKVVIAAAAVTGAVYAYRSYNIETPTQPDGPKVSVVIGGVLATALFGALGIAYATTGDRYPNLHAFLKTAQINARKADQDAAQDNATLEVLLNNAKAHTKAAKTAAALVKAQAPNLLAEDLTVAETALTTALATAIKAYNRITTDAQAPNHLAKDLINAKNTIREITNSIEEDALSIIETCPTPSKNVKTVFNDATRFLKSI